MARNNIVTCKPYPVYKRSGIEWLDDVPAHWEVERLKCSLTNVVEQELFGAGAVLALENVESWTGRITVTDADSPFDSQLKRFQIGDVLFSKLRPYLAKVVQPSNGGLCVGEFLVLRPRCETVTGEFFCLLLRSKPIVDAVTASTFGAKMPRTDWNFIGGMPVVRPPVVEQAAIARFLICMDRRIRLYIRAKERLVALLEEYRRALVSDTVTGRFDVRTGKPYPAYKPTSIKWLGDVPAHWEVERLKGSLTNVVEQEVFGAGAVLALENVESWTDRITVADAGLPFHSRLKRFQAGDVLFSKLRPYLAKVVRPSNGGLCVGEFLVLRPRCETVTGEFFCHLLRSKPIIATVTASTFGAKMPRADWKFIGGMPVVRPPVVEQVAIARFLDRKVERIQKGVAQAQGEIDLLREYHTRLIADVVTGKLDVRNAVAEFPDAELAADEDGVDAVQGEAGFSLTGDSTIHEEDNQ